MRAHPDHSQQQTRQRDTDNLWAPSRQTPIIVFGQGRSGTNWLLNLLDLDPTTHCRSEPNELGGPGWVSLSNGWVRGLDEDRLAEHWDAAVNEASRRIGARDHPIPVNKRHLTMAQRMGSDRLMKGGRLRHLASWMHPRLGQAEWDVPRWQARDLNQARPVLKLNAVPGWASWVIGNRPDTRVVHIVRHPGGFLNSYCHRWLAHQSRPRVAETNRRRLRMIAETEPGWDAIFGDIDTMGAEEAELWFWRYACETIHEAGQAHRHYHLVLYEDVANQPIPTIRQLFARCGLDWDIHVEQAVSHSGFGANRIASSWRDRLSSAQWQLVQKVLENSPLRHWWD